jgi:hypothetical protein
MISHFRPAMLPALAGLLAACGAPSGGGNITASWIGTDTGEVSAAANTVWCRDPRRLEVTAIDGDLGLGLVLYPSDTALPGEFKGFDPGADTVIRPAAAAALRWFTEQAIEGYQSDSGGVTLEAEARRLSGQFRFRLRSLDRNKIVRLTGTLDGLTPGVCQSDSLPGGPTG